MIKISRKFVPKGPINSIPVLVQKMAWRCPDARPLSELILVIFRRIYVSFGLNELNDNLRQRTENRDGHGRRRWQGNSTVLGERKTHTKAKYADTNDENIVKATTPHLAAAPKFVISTTMFHTGAGHPHLFILYNWKCGLANGLVFGFYSIDAVKLHVAMT